MRGKPPPTNCLNLRKRNIPAYAGKTAPPPTPQRSLPEHPRVCGENGDLGGVFSFGVGTSPRMRGKPIAPATSAVVGRNIPAYAGKTKPPILVAMPAAEHPRVCGENALLTQLIFPLKGTSPRMRGKHRPVRPQKLAQGNIPAYAGKTG